ncbi:hypothetical protein ABW21_db0208967 [Orbilia brochopaga]|nr:hypothetical protein ABW21_db0208967 [Drechslerella brochopaga]
MAPPSQSELIRNKNNANKDHFLMRWGPYALWRMLRSHWVIDAPLNSMNTGRILVVSFSAKRTDVMPPKTPAELEEIRTSATYTYVYGYATAVDVCNKNNICLLSNWLPLLLIILSYLAIMYLDLTDWASGSTATVMNIGWQFLIYGYLLFDDFFVKHWECVGRAQVHRKCVVVVAIASLREPVGSDLVPVDDYSLYGEI